MTWQTQVAAGPEHQSPAVCCLPAGCFPQVGPAEGWKNPTGHGLHMFLNYFSCSVLVLWFSNVCLLLCCRGGLGSSEAAPDVRAVARLKRHPRDRNGDWLPRLMIFAAVLVGVGHT